MKPKIVFIGGTPRGLKLLEKLVERGENVACAYILKEDKHEPFQVSSEINAFCREHDIPSVISKRLVPEQIMEILKHKPDVGFVCGWRTILPRKLYEGIPQGCLAAHDSLLPSYRGFAPTSWAIINGEDLTGVTLFKIDGNGVDSGDIFARKEINIDDDTTSSDLYPEVVDSTVSLYEDYLNAFNKGKVSFTKQDESKATFTCKRTPDDGKINWELSAQVIYNFIRALCPPYPYAWTEYKRAKYFIKSATMPKSQVKFIGNIPGRVLQISDEGVLVLCGAGQVLIKTFLTEHGKEMQANQVVDSVQGSLGT
jgi:methionyl-tRNA formyltransferase